MQYVLYRYSRYSNCSTTASSAPWTESTRHPAPGGGGDTAWGPPSNASRRTAVVCGWGEEEGEEVTPEGERREVIAPEEARGEEVSPEGALRDP